MKRCLSKAIESGVKIIFIARKNANQDLSALRSLGINPILIDNLHAKVYINDNYGIVTSLNMNSYSDINSIDIAYTTQNSKERNELIHFVNKYVYELKNISVDLPSIKIRTESENKINLNEFQVYHLFEAFE